MKTEKNKARRLAQIAAWVNENSDLLGLRATIRKTTVSTDRPKPRGLRYRVSTGKGRTGNVIEFWATRTVVAPPSIAGWEPSQALPGTLVHEHNAAETYRENSEVERWLARYVELLDSSVRRRLPKGTVAWAKAWKRW